jgi:DNA-binding NtrC family response regulator
MPEQPAKRKPLVMSIIELGGYPDFSRLYRDLGYDVVVMPSMRKATRELKARKVDVIVAEFNFQSDFRDRTSQLETLMASIAQQPDIRVVVLYDQEQAVQFERFAYRSRIHRSLTYPIDQAALREALQSA